MKKKLMARGGIQGEVDVNTPPPSPYFRHCLEKKPKDHHASLCRKLIWKEILMAMSAVNFSLPDKLFFYP